jgi:hypothetical protein
LSIIINVKRFENSLLLLYSSKLDRNGGVRRNHYAEKCAVMVTFYEEGESQQSIAHAVEAGGPICLRRRFQ